MASRLLNTLRYAALLFTCSILTPISAAALDKDDSCSIPEKPLPPVELPWSSYEALCKTDFGKKWVGGIPPSDNWPKGSNAYGKKTQDFLDSLIYRKPVAEGGLGWLHDARWRLTGDQAGAQMSCSSGAKHWSNEVHPAVKIYYSPEMMQWLCENRFPGKEADNPPSLPDGAMIIKEMHPVTKLAYRPNTAGDNPRLGKVAGKAWLDADYDQSLNGLSWTIMTKGSQSVDGWYWAYFGYNGEGKVVYNPPILSRSALTTAVDDKGYPLILDEKTGLPLPSGKQNPPPHGPWYPTFDSYAKPDVVYPNAGFGNYCIACHGAAETESTFSNLENIMDQGHQYDYLTKIPTLSKTVLVDNESSVNEHQERLASSLPALHDTQIEEGVNERAPFPPYKPINADKFEKTFPQFAGLTYDDVWQHRLPGQTWDHVIASGKDADGQQTGINKKQFLTSDQCLTCHDASSPASQTPNLPNMQVNTVDGEQINLSEFAEWKASPMGLAGRDPIFYSMLESELNRADEETDLQKFAPCIQNTCLHCHGNMGQRQHARDTKGQEGSDLCKGFESLTDPSAKDGKWTDEQREAAGYGGKPFLRSMMAAWQGDGKGEMPSHGEYGALGRDGISCATCHHISEKDLGLSGKTFTGNFRTGPADKMYGPFKDVLTKPMENSLGITPEYNSALSKSGVCGTCHAIYLPVFDNNGKYVKSAFEQTTYLEWLNSGFNEENNNVPASDWKSCQQCHMSDDYVYTDKAGKKHEISLNDTKIANITDGNFPHADYLQKDMEMKPRDYKRHTMYGLNAFLNQYFQQFPLLLGIRQQSEMTSATTPLITGQESVIQIARSATANVDVKVSKSAGEIVADVTVQNLGGHKLPSGVSFRRAFIEFKVLDADGKALWASGLTSSLGIIQDGLNKTDLATEFLKAAKEGDCKEGHQPHYEVISKPCQVQIYEELAHDSSGVFTTSFIHRYEEIKDNRLLPKGYRVLVDGEVEPDYCKPYCRDSDPIGKAKNDPDYQGNQKTGVAGQDTVQYKIALTAEQMSKAVKVTATLYSQATAPYFLNQRFDDAKKGSRKADTQRLYFIQSHLNTDAKSKSGEKYLDQYKLKINEASADL